MEEIMIKKNKNHYNDNMASMMSTTSQDQKNPTEDHQPITTSTTCPTWKLYENPFYNNNCHQNHHHHHQINQTAQNSQQQSQAIAATKNLQCLQLPLSARKLAASFLDLALFRPANIMEPEELESARAQIAELRAELESERRARKRLESMNKRLAKEAAEERRARESAERACEDLAREVSSERSEAARMRREIEEERKMMRMSEVLREERVQMKLADAKIALEEKLSELDAQLGFRKNHHSFPAKLRQLVLGDKLSSSSSTTTTLSDDHRNDDNNKNDVRVNSMESLRSACFLSGTSHYDLSKQNLYGCKNSDGISTSTTLPAFQRKSVLPETENPHIMRGIKGFVEFPRVVRAIGAKNRQWGTKLECQKAQLRILLKQKSPIRSSINNLIIS